MKSIRRNSNLAKFIRYCQNRLARPTSAPDLIVRGGNLSPLVVQKPWGVETTYGVTPYFAVRRIQLDAHAALSRQFHVVKSEVYIVIEGSGVLELGHDTSVLHYLSPGDAVFIAAGTVHRLVTDVGIVIVEASTPQITDIVRLEDRYGREVVASLDVDRYLATMRDKWTT